MNGSPAALLFSTRRFVRCPCHDDFLSQTITHHPPTSCTTERLHWRGYFNQRNHVLPLPLPPPTPYNKGAHETIVLPGRSTGRARQPDVIISTTFPLYSAFHPPELVLYFFLVCLFFFFNSFSFTFSITFKYCILANINVYTLEFFPKYFLKIFEDFKIFSILFIVIAYLDV